MIYRNDLINKKIEDEGLTIEGLAEMADLNKNTIVKVRDGKEIKVTTLRKVADTLNIPMNELFEEKQPA